MTHSILFLGLLIVAYSSGSQAKNAFLQYWEEHIGLPQPPHWLVAKASPLSSHQVAVYMNLMEKNEFSSHLHSFCMQANVACSTNAMVKNMTNSTDLPPLAQWTFSKYKYDVKQKEIPLSIANQGGLPYFRKSMVKEGGSIPVPDLRDPMSYKSFLPRALASKIPFSSARKVELKKLFGVVDGSIMDEYIQGTLEVCEKVPSRGKHHTCATSAEDLIDFIAMKVGHHVLIWSTENIEGSYENVTIGAVKLVYGNLSESPALCHSPPFLFQVYYCHVLPKVEVYTVDVHARKKMNHMIMACHYDTSNWNPNHIAFEQLGFGPGLIEVCHWITENGLILTKTLG
ncbi:polygalacturonase non-catalytic subunit AroGP2-like [Macadamia integrifolia]|uniref:polygalacturonase non-catalytic subunit AroGP2-like n=1 Tax=Macadamia integrifolia TaxID=60698 RepID=UPI001C5296C5|nr:polygalacturonase non-catalytic subunit AroGP2-like [Macadamia integrifolia]